MVPDRDGSPAVAWSWSTVDGLVVLRTPRLLLRAWGDADRAAFAAMNADPVVMADLPAPLDRAGSDALLDRLAAQHAARGFTCWALEVTDPALLERTGGGAPAGFAGLSVPGFVPPFAHHEPCVEVGWRLAAPWWGHGLATEAAAASLAYAGAVLNLPEVVSFTTPRNARSIAVMRRLGMRPDGTFEHPRAAPGDWWRRHVLYRITPATAGPARS
jgi:ribosomal-protein-alanine N-acetyltransferase